MDKLEYVLTLAEERNLTRAAARLYISQPTLTNYINRLERELGVRLFDRSVQPIEVTRAGQVYIEDMKKIQSRELSLRAKLQLLGRPGRTLAVGVPSLRGEDLLPKPVAAFRRAFSDVSLEIDTRVEEYLEKELAEGNLDVIIGALSTAYSGVHYECLREDRFYLLVPRSYPFVAQAESQPEALGHLQRKSQAGISERLLQASLPGTPENPCVLDGQELNGACFLLPRTGGGQYRVVMKLLEKYGVIPGSEIRCSNIHTLYQLAGEGCGILFTVPEAISHNYPQYRDRLACCVLQNEIMTQKTYIAWRQDSAKTELIEAFYECLKKAECMWIMIMSG